MDKTPLTPVALLEIAISHAYCAEHLLTNNAQILINKDEVDTLLPVISLMHEAFELTLKAYLLHQDKPIHHKSLNDLIASEPGIHISKQEIELLMTLSKQNAFRKGVSYELWQTRQELQVFCEQIMTLFARINQQKPLELQTDYQ